MCAVTASPSRGVDAIPARTRNYAVVNHIIGRSRALVLAASMLLSHAVTAQVASDPATALTLAEATSWRSWVGVPLRFTTPTFDVVVTSPLSRAWLAAHDDPRQIARSCTELEVAPSDTLAGGSFVDWQAVDSAMPPASADAVVITIAPAAATPSACRNHAPGSPGAIAAGVAFQTYAFHDPSRDVMNARLIVNGERVSPLRVERATRRALLPKGARPGGPGSSIVRVFVDPNHFVPDDSGQLPIVAINTEMAAGYLDVSFELRTNVRRQVWEDLLPSTIAAAGSAGRPVALTLPPARDDRLRRAVELDQTGDTRAAAVLYHASLYDPALAKSGQREARVRLALSLAALGDSASARVVAAPVVEREPCFSLAAAAPPDAHRLFTVASRPRCEHDVGGVIVRSLIFPGLGHVRARREKTGLAVAVASIALFAFSASNHSTSRVEYDRYLEAESAARAVVLYKRAHAARADARRGAIFGASVWALGAVEASYTEWRHAGAMRPITDYGAVGVGAVPDNGRMRLAVSIRF